MFDSADPSHRDIAHARLRLTLRRLQLPIRKVAFVVAAILVDRLTCAAAWVR